MINAKEAVRRSLFNKKDFVENRIWIDSTLYAIEKEIKKNTDKGNFYCNYTIEWDGDDTLIHYIIKLLDIEGFNILESSCNVFTKQNGKYFIEISW